MNALEAEAMKNMETRFVDNPCRGIVVGKDTHDRQVHLAWIMGRSESSRNRIYVVGDDRTVREIFTTLKRRARRTPLETSSSTPRWRLRSAAYSMS